MKKRSKNIREPAFNALKKQTLSLLLYKSMFWVRKYKQAIYSQFGRKFFALKSFLLRRALAIAMSMCEWLVNT